MTTDSRTARTVATAHRSILGQESAEEQVADENNPTDPWGIQADPEDAAEQVVQSIEESIPTDDDDGNGPGPEDPGTSDPATSDAVSEDPDSDVEWKETKEHESPDELGDPATSETDLGTVGDVSDSTEPVPDQDPHPEPAEDQSSAKASEADEHSSSSAPTSPMVEAARSAFDTVPAESDEDLPDDLPTWVEADATNAEHDGAGHDDLDATASEAPPSDDLEDAVAELAATTDSGESQDAGEENGFVLPEWGTEGAPPEPMIVEDENESDATEEATEPDPTSEPVVESVDPPDEAGDQATDQGTDPTTEHEAPAGLGTESATQWGSKWSESAQGWVEDSEGRPFWRPIITTAGTVAQWSVDTHLGVVSGSREVSGSDLSVARTDAAQAMLDEALERGAHAVIGTAFQVVRVDSLSFIIASGTAVTLSAND